MVKNSVRRALQDAEGVNSRGEPLTSHSRSHPTSGRGRKLDVGKFCHTLRKIRVRYTNSYQTTQSSRRKSSPLVPRRSVPVLLLAGRRPHHGPSPQSILACTNPPARSASTRRLARCRAFSVKPPVRSVGSPARPPSTSPMLRTGR